jgi:spermidine/putrescine transport system substrate-binding protein
VTLRILTWSDYIDPDVVAEFEAATGIGIDFVYFETSEGRDDLLIASDGAGYDIILSHDNAQQLYVQRDWLAPITLADVPNLRHIESRWRKVDPESQAFGVPYTWGTLGIAYRADLVSSPITRWMDLFDPAEELKGRIVMIKDSRELVGKALLASGYSLNSIDPQGLAAARELLLRQKPYVKAYSYIALNEDSALLTGEVWAAQLYNGDVVMLQEYNPDIEFVVPEEGTNLWLDLWTVASQSRHKAAAFKFIDFINEPEIAARIAEFVYYATPNEAAAKLLPPEFHANPVIYPPEDVLQRSEQHELLPPRIMRAWNAVFSEIVN